jgi:ferric-dicitrate binding protein FerR (iron transport regulator)
VAAAEAVGAAADVRGDVQARQLEAVRNLKSGAELLLKDLIETQDQSFARLDLSGGTIVHLGSKARLLIDEFVAESGGVLELGEGALLFDRAEDLPKIDLTVRSRFGLIAVRGTRFFAGPSRGVFGIFVDRGKIDVEAAGVTRSLVAGQGADIAAEGQPPSEVKTWGKPRIAEALASVGL